MTKQSMQRTQSFRWSSRYELYSWFKEHFGLEKKQVDDEIHRVMAQFRPRKGQVIRTQELWQKVGLTLEAALSQKDSPAEDHGENAAREADTAGRKHSPGTQSDPDDQEDVAYLDDL